MWFRFESSLTLNIRAFILRSTITTLKDSALAPPDSDQTTMVPFTTEVSQDEAADSAADSISDAPLEPTLTSGLASEAVEPLLPSGSASKTSDMEIETDVVHTLGCLGDWLSNDEFDNYSDSDSLMPRKPKTS